MVVSWQFVPKKGRDSKKRQLLMVNSCIINFYKFDHQSEDLTAIGPFVGASLAKRSLPRQIRAPHHVAAF